MSDLEAMAREAAEEARILFRASRFGGACSRAYYAMFNAARAMLLAKGHTREKAKTHKTVLRLFSREFVQDGSFDPELARALRKAADARHVADYERGITRAEAAQVMATLEAFMQNAEALLTALAKEGRRND
jgi:uncharacterized protein (UPF0332 family)